MKILKLFGLHIQKYTVAESFCETRITVRPGITQYARILLCKFIAIEYKRFLLVLQVIKK